ncbi:DUF885 domain-containing protein [Qipengyuania sphaerica]|uniref:DUF885 domain-containing protein n=1 Tax=Qipengyuania sphaerica TaxID=2867243 RepID=UPI001C8688C4|nr:DUF885 domain-containing protein [Qipengyuania sphaerica]MBX7539805.1 DUF885 domain-containing protein [Qipengyuania sphaerica]
MGNSRVFRAVMACGTALALASCGGGDGSSGGGTGIAPTPTPSSNPSPAPTPTPTPAPPVVLSARLTAVFDAAEAGYDEMFPLNAQLRGKSEYAGRFGDYLSDAWYAELQRQAQANLDALAGIDRSKLNTPSQIAYDAFAFKERQTLALFDPAVLPFERGLPMNHITGIQAFYPSYASGDGPIPFETLEDYENNISRTKEFAVALDATADAFRRGAILGVVESRNTIDIVISQLGALADDSVTGSPFYKPVTNFPASISSADQSRLQTEYADMVTNDVLPAIRRLRNYLQNEYRLQARTTPGLAGLAGGQAYYDHLIEANTSLDLAAPAIHQTGKDEVARILGRMDAIRRSQGFSGTLDQFDQSLHQNAAYGVSSRAAYQQLFEDIGDRVVPKAYGLFRYQPTSQLSIKPYDAVQEQFMFAASYLPGTADGSRPGIFRYNASSFGGHKLASTSLFMHEGVPGHHFQIMLARENEGLPDFMNGTGLIAYVEGWALYAETLGYDMKFYDDELVEYGHLTQELLRALRLVVDTGIHHFGWSRQQALNYVAANSPYNNGLPGEIDRYIGWPSQALGYKIGELKMQELRAESVAALGDTREVLKGFHHQVLGTGVIPLPVLEAKVDAWVAAGS